MAYVRWQAVTYLNLARKHETQSNCKQSVKRLRRGKIHSLRDHENRHQVINFFQSRE